MVHAGHTLAKGKVTAGRYAGADHVHVLRRGLHSTEIDEAVQAARLTRRIPVIVQGFSAALALALARDTELVATVPERYTAGLRHGMHSFALPITIAPFTLSMIWRPRMDGRGNAGDDLFAVSPRPATAALGQ